MNPLFLAFELLIGVLFALCLGHAWRRAPHVAWWLLVGVVFGLLLEWGTIRQLDTYTYGHFALMLCPVPVAIGVAWGVIVYGARLYSQVALPGDHPDRAQGEEGGAARSVAFVPSQASLPWHRACRPERIWQAERDEPRGSSERQQGV